MKLLISYLVGVIFSIGLTVSGMVDPNRVIGFLDIFRDWDPALVFVMGGAAGLNLILFRFVLKRKNPIFAPSFSLPTSTTVDWRLIVGSALFGIGWGIGGICPGPGIANLFTLKAEVFAFIIAMLGGMLVFKWVNQFLPK